MTARTPVLSSLREAPVVGKFYLVPVVTYGLFDRQDDDWPVLGPLHHDREHIGFEPLHFHLDGRFLSTRQLRSFEAQDKWFDRKYPAGSTLNAKPLAQKRYGDRGPVDPAPLLPRRAHLKRLKCRRPIQPWVVSHLTAHWELEKNYGQKPIRKSDGRLLCPHRKADLSQFPVDADGMVTCPLHGLRVRCSPG